MHFRGLGSIFLFVVVVSCTPGEAVPPVVDDAFPPVIGLATIEDEDPAIDKVRYSLTAHVADVKLIGDLAPTRMFTYNGAVPGPLLQARIAPPLRQRSRHC